MKPSLLLSLVSLAVAASPSALRQRSVDPALTSRSIGPQTASSSSSARDIHYTYNWAGVSRAGTNIHSVSALLQVPSVTGPSNSSVSAWVGIDGNAACPSILQTGLIFYADGSFLAWCEWYPGPTLGFVGNSITIHPGDNVTMRVEAPTATSGVARLTNLSTGQDVQYAFEKQPPLCRENADWIVEDYTGNGKRVPLADFRAVVFQDAKAEGDGGVLGPKEGAVYDIVDEKNKVMTTCGSGDTNVWCLYIG